MTERTTPERLEELARGACRTCGGTGQIICMNSAFMTDKLRKERCGICGGSGVSSYRDDPKYVRWQATQRATFPWHADLTPERKEALRAQASALREPGEAGW